MRWIGYRARHGFKRKPDARPGNAHSADGWDGVLKPVVARYQGKVSRIYLRADAAFAMPEVYEFLEAERIKYATTFGPILISFSFKVVSDQSLIGSGVASVRRKLPRL